jgi:hypothetical protein
MRRWIGLLLAFALLITLADYVAWRLALGRMQAGLQTLLADMRAGGWHVHCSAPETGGWPLSATLAVSDVHAEGGTWGVPGGVAWSAERLVLTIALTDPRHLSVSPQGEETLRISHIPAVAFSADRIDIRVPLGEGRPDHASLDAAAVAGGLKASGRRQDVRIGQLSLQLHARQDNGALNATLGFTAEAIGLPDTGRWPLGGSVTSLTVAVVLTSPPVSGADSRSQAESWRDGGGKLSLPNIGLRWGPLSLEGDAAMGLDARLQPAGTGHAHVVGTAAAIDALAAAGVIGPGMAVTYNAVLGLMAHAPESAIDIPLTLRDSTLSLGAIPLARFHDIAWH